MEVDEGNAGFDGGRKYVLQAHHETGDLYAAWYANQEPYPERNTEEFEAPFNHDGFQDVYYTYSTDDGQSWAPNVRITDRIINREIGVWSNNVHSHMNVGIASSNEGAFFAWQDTRNGNYENEAEDIYFASAWHDDAAAPVATSSATAGWSPWLLLAAGVLAGMGLAMVIAVGLVRRSRVTS